MREEERGGEGSRHDLFFLLASLSLSLSRRWIVTHRWAIALQAAPACHISTTFHRDYRLLKQLLRWSRNTWRSDMESLFADRTVWSSHPFTAYVMLDKMVNPFTLLYGVVAVTIISFSGQFQEWQVWSVYLLWLLVSRTMKLMPHLRRKPGHIVYLLHYIIFSYIAAIVKIYALCTLHRTGKGKSGEGTGQESTHCAFGGLMQSGELDLAKRKRCSSSSSRRRLASSSRRCRAPMASSFPEAVCSSHSKQTNKHARFDSIRFDSIRLDSTRLDFFLV